MKIGIISGVISSVIVVIFIQPILSVTWGAITVVGSHVHQGYVDRIYKNAAVADRNLLGDMTFLYLLMLPALVSLIFSFRFRLGHRPEWPFSHRVLNVFSVAAALLSVVTILVGFSLSSGILEISASFNQRLTVLAPAISDTEYKTFRARWASMSTEADYKSLVSDMESRSKDLKVILPKLRTP